MTRHSRPVDRGADNPKSKLTEPQVAEIRRRPRREKGAYMTEKLRDIAHSLRGEISVSETEHIFNCADELDKLRARVVALEAALDIVQKADVKLESERDAAVLAERERTIKIMLDLFDDSPNAQRVAAAIRSRRQRREPT